MGSRYIRPVIASYLPRLLPLLLSLCALVSAAPAHSATPDSTYASYMQQCDDYVRHYQPLYMYGQDTFAVSKFAPVPAGLDDWLQRCAIAHDYTPLKYACAIVLLQNQEWLSAGRPDYMIAEGLLQRNGFIALLREAMGRGRLSDSVTDAEYLPFTSGDLCYWIRHNKKKIPGYEYLVPFLERK